MKRGNSHVGASVSERSIKSAALLRDLNALDPYLPQRSELLLAGVPEHRVDALYPLTFESLAEGLLEHMRPHPVDYLSRLNEHMVSRILTKSNTIQSLSASLRDQWQQIDRNPRTGFWQSCASCLPRSATRWHTQCLLGCGQLQRAAAAHVVDGNASLRAAAAPASQFGSGHDVGRPQYAAKPLLR